MKDIDDSKWESKGDGSVVVRVQPPGTVSHPRLYRYRYRYVGYRCTVLLPISRGGSFKQKYYTRGFSEYPCSPSTDSAPTRHTFPHFPRPSADHTQWHCLYSVTIGDDQHTHGFYIPPRLMYSVYLRYKVWQHKQIPSSNCTSVQLMSKIVRCFILSIIFSLTELKYDCNNVPIGTVKHI